MLRPFLHAFAAVFALTGCAVLGLFFFADRGSVPVRPEPFPLAAEAALPASSSLPFLLPVPLAPPPVSVEGTPLPEPRRDVPWPEGVRLSAPPVRAYNGMRAEFPFPPTTTPVVVPVLMYHHIRPLTSKLTAQEKRYSVDPQVFRAQILSLLDAGFTPVRLADFAAAVLADDPSRLPAKPVLLTFDDGFRDHYEEVFPLLQEARIPATFFVLSQGFESIYLTKPMLREMAASPYVAIAAHTRRHADLTRLSATARQQQIKGSKDGLEALLGVPVDAFAYPYGSANDAVRRDVEAAGYQLGFGIRLGSFHGSASRWQLRRIPVTNGWDMTPILERFLLPRS